MNRTEKTLLEQMKISDLEIRRRLALLDISCQDLELLKSQEAWIQANADSLVDQFYLQQVEDDEIALLIGDSETLDRLKLAQKQYILDLFTGVCDSHYVNNRLRIGKVHKRIGVEPKLYLSAVSRLKEILIATLEQSPDNKPQLSAILLALHKLFYFDITLVFDTYIDGLIGEVETEKKKAEAYAASLEEIVAERTAQLELQARIDPLTKLNNQGVFHSALEHELRTAKRRSTTLSLIYFDVDNFKSINDQFGHLHGDEVLKQLGQLMLQHSRESDIACRYGGDEFCLILPECSASNAIHICEKLIEEFKQHFAEYSLSFGIADSQAYATAAELLKAADQNMYQAKKSKGFEICTGSVDKIIRDSLKSIKTSV